MADVHEFRCPGCGYAARVAGEPVATSMFYFETISCRDCRELRDIPFATRVSDVKDGEGLADPAQKSDDSALEDLWAQYHREFEDALNEHRPVNVQLINDLHAAIRSQQTAAKLSGYRELDPRCTRSEEHVWESWRHPGPCPKCGETMEKDSG